jgi:hypothetical protein
VLAVATLLAGCGDSGNDDALAGGAVRAFLEVCGRGEGRLAQELVVPASRSVFVDETGTDAGCSRVLDLPDGTDLSRAHMEDVDATDGAAEATVVAGHQRRTVSVTLRRGTWLLEGPAPLS